tara:strand:+ start:931 stop:1833 length:903 start_codon:yes stop_codon:yes gene_type:complete
MQFILKTVLTSPILLLFLVYYTFKYKNKMKTIKELDNFPIFSVLIPLYNNADYIEGCVNSVINQSFQNFEIIIIDDYSQDDSYEKVKKLSIIYGEKVKVYKNEKNLGVYKTLNRCLELSNGQYVCLLGSDDKFHINRLKEDYRCLKHKDIVISRYIREKEESNKYYSDLYGEIESPYGYGESMITFKKSIIKDIGPFLICRFGSDTEFGERIKLIYGKESIFFNNKVLYVSIHKKNRDNLTIKYSKETRKKFIEYYKILHNNYNKKIDDAIQKQLRDIAKTFSLDDIDNQKNLSILRIKI